LSDSHQVLGRAAFGQTFSWEVLKDINNPTGEMTFFRSLKSVSKDFIPIYALPTVSMPSLRGLSDLPQWAFSLPNAYLQRVKEAFTRFESVTRTIIREVQTKDAGERRNDLLRLFVKANSAEKNKLSDDDLGKAPDHVWWS
jgi:hypothetical protein